MNVTKIEAVKKLIGKMLETYEKEFKEAGIAVGVGFASITDIDAYLRLEVLDLNEFGEKINPKVENFKKHYTLYGLTPSDLGIKLMLYNREYVFAGLDIHKRTNPIIMRREDGVECSMKADDFKAQKEYQYKGRNV